MEQRLRRKLRWAALSPEEIAASAASLASTTGVDAGTLLPAMLAWMELDFPAALTAWRSVPRGESLDYALFRIVQEMDDSLLAAFLKDLPGPNVCSLLSWSNLPIPQQWQLFCAAVPQCLRGGECEGASGLFDDSSAEEAALLLPQLLTLPRSSWRDATLEDILGKPYISPVEALAWAKQCPQPGLRRELALSSLARIAGLLREGGTVELDAATRAEVEEYCGYTVSIPAALENPELLAGLTGSARAQAFRAFLETAAKKGPVEGMAALETLAATDPARRLEWLGKFAESLSGEDAFAVLESLHDPASRTKLLEEAYSKMQRLDQDRLLKIMETLPATGNLAGVFTRLAFGMDRETVTAWALSLKDPVARRAALGGMISDWAEKSPTDAAAFIAALPDAADRERLYWMLPTSDTTTSQLATVAAGIASPDERRHFLMESFSMKSSQSYQTTDPLLVAGLEHDPEAMAMEPNARNAVGSAAGNLAARDPAQAWEWAQTLPAGPLQETSVASITEAWMAKSPEDASAWAGHLPAGPLRDAAAESIVRRILTDDPERAAAWAATLQNPALRARWQAAITSSQEK